MYIFPLTFIPIATDSIAMCWIVPSIISLEKIMDDFSWLEGFLKESASAKYL